MGFADSASTSQLRLHAFGFAASISHLEFRVLGFFAFSAASVARLRFAAFASPFRHRGFVSVASAFRIFLSECSSFASASWLRLCGLCFATSALWLQFRSFGFAAPALRLSLFGPGFTDATARLRHRGFGIAASASSSQLRAYGFGLIRLCRFACVLSTLRLRLHGVGFAASPSFGVAALASRLRLRSFGLRLRLREFCFAASASRAWLSQRSAWQLAFQGFASQLRLRRLRSRRGFAASASWPRLRGFGFADQASQLWPASFVISSLALRLQHCGFNFVVSISRLGIRLRSPMLRSRR